MNPLTKEEQVRYSRQSILQEMGVKGQEKIKNSKILVVGAGGLGCPILQYLTAAGVGTIGIVDFDKVELHNLHRQVLYTIEDIGQLKAEVAALKLKKLNSNVELKVFSFTLNDSNALDIISEFDIIIDGTDNFLTKYLINDTCVKLNKTLVYGSVYKYEGQMAVLNYNGSPHLRDIFPDDSHVQNVPDCQEAGVLGTVPGMIGICMANTVIQIILGSCLPELLLFNFKNLEVKHIRL